MNQKPLTFLLHDVVWKIDAEADQILKAEHGLSFAKFYILAVLYSCQPTTQADLATCLMYSPAAVSKALQPLQEDGLVEVGPHPTHARKNLVSLTPKANALVAQCTTQLEGLFVRRIEEAGLNPEVLRNNLNIINQVFKGSSNE